MRRRTGRYSEDAIADRESLRRVVAWCAACAANVACKCGVPRAAATRAGGGRGLACASSSGLLRLMALYLGELFSLPAAGASSFEKSKDFFRIELLWRGGGSRGARPP